jgi:hypothetical protein
MNAAYGQASFILKFVPSTFASTCDLTTYRLSARLPTVKILPSEFMTLTFSRHDKTSNSTYRWFIFP